MPADDLDQAVRRADPDRWLASRFIADPAARADVIALLSFDHELARAGRVASNTLVAEIRLTWWREALDEIFGERTVRPHPVTRAFEACVRRHDLSRALCDALVDAHIDALDARPWTLAEAVAWADRAAGSAAVLTARILDPAAPPDAPAIAGRALGLHRLRSMGLIAPDVVRAPIAASLAAANRDASRLSVAAFPAVAAATLARVEKPSAFSARARLLLAVARGRV